MFRTTSETEGEAILSPPVIHYLPVVLRGSMLPVFGVRVSVTFHLMYFHINFSSV